MVLRQDLQQQLAILPAKAMPDTGYEFAGWLSKSDGVPKR
jgi:hypothetical protein